MSVFTGGYPDENYVMKLINMREYTQFGRVFGPLIYMYIGGIFVITFVGCMVQFQIKQKHPNETEKEKKKENETKENHNTNCNLPIEDEKNVKKEQQIPEDVKTPTTNT